jgi:choline dehydrogenase-like flavoprotein
MDAWPIGYDQVTSYFSDALSYLGINAELANENPWRSTGSARPSLPDDDLELDFSLWAPRPNMAQVYGQELTESAYADVILHANVVDFDGDSSSGRVTEAIVRTLGGKEVRVRGRTFVICCGAIETARMLLAARSLQPRGLGNSSGLVGKYFQDHLTIEVGEILSKDLRGLHEVLGNLYVRGVKHMPKLTLSADYERAHGLLDAGGHIRVDAPASGYDLARSIVRGIADRKPIPETMRRIASAVPHVGTVAAAAWSVCVRKRAYFHPESRLFLEAHAEQAPQDDSCVSLSDSVDALGIPRARLNWTVSDASAEAARAFGEVVGERLRSTGLGELRRDGPLFTGELSHVPMADLYHHMGTTRMSVEPHDGVVDGNCRLHDIENVYIGGAAVFPSGGWSNPTHTAIALALRLADWIARDSARSTRSAADGKAANETHRRDHVRA